jgi:hypothetical protein
MDSTAQAAAPRVVLTKDAGVSRSGVIGLAAGLRAATLSSGRGNSGYTGCQGPEATQHRRTSWPGLDKVVAAVVAQGERPGAGRDRPTQEGSPAAWLRST